ncbi:phosphoadenosine phosphosulfate reductase domain-containing protein [Spirosoma radiotolerans]|uniref:Phosphoadenosine phosphosulphate reductase domain-containing protein n=1 Tax=Spirosoma radiotolerans TaxID=1379870 RepID=A0A0E3ZVA3_9BACT|nr:phosphoadenosine phosphosulfate reductase family protein [Spirosoma radiotolerans]AKD55009.1 hypothetical protein SD10_08935 [Spirosoma radiotolerans]
MNQLALFPQSATLAIPDVIRKALSDGATLAISISGGKDSHALLIELSRWFRQQHFNGQLFAIHADLGRAEWPQTPDFVKRICEENDVPLIVVQRAKGDLVARLEERLEATSGTGKPFWPDAQNRYCTSHNKSGPIDIELRKPFWPSAANRYCTSDSKRGPIDTALRAENPVIISAEGVRGDESSARAKKAVVEVRTGITASSTDPIRNLSAMTPAQSLFCQQKGQRVAFNWRPLLYWNEEMIWDSIGTSLAELRERQAMYKAGLYDPALRGWLAHPAYVFGNTRLSCALCVLGSKSDLTNGANHNPDLYRHYLELERAGNSTFKNGWSLSELPVTGRAKELRDEYLSGR